MPNLKVSDSLKVTASSSINDIVTDRENLKLVLETIRDSFEVCSPNEEGQTKEIIFTKDHLQYFIDRL